MKLIWISDPHLEFLDSVSAEKFLGTLKRYGDAIMITGDISTAIAGSRHWQMLADIMMPVYFVLGNHDHYMGSMAQVWKETRERVAMHPQLHWMNGEALRLTETTWIVGADGWGDGRAGLGDASTIRLNDCNLIAELQNLESADLYGKLNQLGDESSTLLRSALKRAFDTGAKKIIVATHVPPFPEAAMYQNKPSDGGHAPHFVNIALGALLLEVASGYPDVDFRVFCGHTHHRASCKPLPNLAVEVAGSDYVAEISAVIDI